jgi:hypothetical protein
VLLSGDGSFLFGSAKVIIRNRSGQIFSLEFFLRGENPADNQWNFRHNLKKGRFRQVRERDPDIMMHIPVTENAVKSTHLSAETHTIIRQK